VPKGLQSKKVGSRSSLGTQYLTQGARLKSGPLLYGHKHDHQFSHELILSMFFYLQSVMTQLREVSELSHVIQTLDKGVAQWVFLQKERFEHYSQLILFIVLTLHYVHHYCANKYECRNSKLNLNANVLSL